MVTGEGLPPWRGQCGSSLKCMPPPPMLPAAKLAAIVPSSAAAPFTKQNGQPDLAATHPFLKEDVSAKSRSMQETAPTCATTASLATPFNLLTRCIVCFQNVVHLARLLVMLKILMRGF